MMQNCLDSIDMIEWHKGPIVSIKFELPDELSRAAIFQRYAKHLSDDERRDLANHTMGMSGRNIADVCKGNNDSKKKYLL